LSTKNALTLANKITISRILLIPFFIGSVLYSNLTFAFIVFVIAAISDGVDGFVARATGQRTELGKVLDPIADKLLILSAFICLSVTPRLSPSLKLPPYVPIIIISRDAIILLGVLLIYFIKGKFDPKPTFISKATTFLQFLTVVSILLGFPLSVILWNITVGFTVVSGADYIVKGSRMLNER